MIRVYDMHTPQSTFESNDCHNGLRILNPYYAYITEELNGKYSYEIQVPMLPDDDSWQFIKIHNIIKSSGGQLFQIYKTVHSTVSGVPMVTAYANHIWYYLADMCVIECEDTRSAYWTMSDLFTEKSRPRYDGDQWGPGTTLFSHGTGLTDYNFSWSVDLGNAYKYYKYKKCSLAYAILGSADSVVNLWNGYLHRDNFRFSINKDRKEGTSDNAFELVYGYNCTAVKYTEDFSKCITEHWGWDQFGHYYGTSIIPDSGDFPRQVISAADYSLNETYEEKEIEDLGELVKSYFSQNTNSSVNFEVNYVDPKGTSYDFSGWDSLRTLKVGDSGYVTGLNGERREQTIIYVKYNDVTERIDSLKLGEFKHSDLHQTRWDKIFSDDNAAYRRLDIVEKRMDYFELVQEQQEENNNA